MLIDCSCIFDNNIIVRYCSAKRLHYLNRLISILLLLNFLLFILPVNTKKGIAKQFTTSMPAEEEHGTHKGIDIDEIGHKLLHPLKHFTLSHDIFYLISREKFAHFKLHTPAVDWLETFSPPPDLV